MKTELTPEDVAVLQGLRAAGCAVCVFLPHELPNSEPDDVEDAMAEGGWGRINYDDAQDEERNKVKR